VSHTARALQLALQLVGTWVVAGWLVRGLFLVAEPRFPSLTRYLNRPATWQWRFEVGAVGAVLFGLLLWCVELR
jgi:hypothetical protein